MPLDAIPPPSAPAPTGVNDWITAPPAAPAPAAKAAADDWITKPEPPAIDSEGNMVSPEEMKRGAAFAESMGARLTGTDRPPAEPTTDTIAPGLRNAIAPAANTTYGVVLPLARDQATGDVRLALPSSLRSLATGALDLAEGPTTGTVTPEATGALANIAVSGGLTPSLARGSSAAIREAAGLGAAPAADTLRPSITAREVQARDGVPIMEAWKRANAENTGRAAGAVADIGKATDINGVIAAAGKAAQTPGAAGLDDLFAPRPVGEEETGRAAAMGSHAEASAQPGEIVTPDQSAEPGVAPGATPYTPLSKEPKRLIQFLREPTTLMPDTIFARTIPGGIQDVGGDVAAAIGGPKGRPGLINNAAGRSLDDAALDAWQAGYFPEHDQRPEINDLINAIREDHTGNAQYSMNDADAAVAHQYAQAHNNEIDRIATQTGINPSGMTRDQFFDAVSDHLSAEDQAAAQTVTDNAHQVLFDKAVASAKKDGTDYGTTVPRSLPELEDAYRQEDATRTALGGAADDAESGPIPSNAGTGQAGGGPGGGVAGAAGRPGTQASVPAATPTLELIPKTSAEAKAVAAAYYQKADQIGGTLLPDFTNKFIDKAESIAPQTPEGRAIAGDTAITGLVERLQALRDKPISLQGAQEIDERLGDLIDKEFGLKGLSKEGRELLDLQTSFRNMILDAGPADTTGGTAGFEAIKQGRVAWAQAMKMMDFERILTRAALTDNPVTSIRAGIRTLLSNPARARGYSPEEIAALKDASNRGVIGGVLHVFGSRLTPLAVGAAGLSSGVIPGLVGASLMHGGSSLMRSGATFMQMRRTNHAMSVLGSRVPRSP